MAFSDAYVTIQIPFNSISLKFSRAFYEWVKLHVYLVSAASQENNDCTFVEYWVFYSVKLSVNYNICPKQQWPERCPLHLFQVRPSADQESFLIHPFGLLYSEVTASSLQKINPDGSVVDQGSTNLGVNKAGILLHSSIHGARKDARAIIHLHQEDTVAVSL